MKIDDLYVSILKIINFASVTLLWPHQKIDKALGFINITGTFML